MECMVELVVGDSLNDAIPQVANHHKVVLPQGGA
jgi:hypothetical protein